MFYKRELINSFETIGYSWYVFYGYCSIGPRGRFYLYLYHCDYIGLLGTGFMQVLYLGRAPRTKETLPDFLKWYRVTRHPLVFHGLTGSQRTLGFGASQLGIRVKVYEYLGSSGWVSITTRWFDVKYRYMEA